MRHKRRWCLVRRAAAAVAAAAVVLNAPGDAWAVDTTAAIDRGVRYLEGRQADNGALPSATSRAYDVAEAVIAVAASGRGGPTLDRALARIAADGPASITRAGHAGRIVMALVATGHDPHRFGGYDYVARITASYQPASGAYDNGVYANALAVLGLQAAGEAVPAQAITYLRANQCASGGFAHQPGCLNPPDVDTTSMVLSVLAAAGIAPDDLTRRNARDWLLRAQNRSGGFGLQPGDADNANSTGLALSVVRALGEDPASAPWARGNADPATALLRLQLASGAFTYVASDPKPNDYATVQALPGLAGMAWPPTRSLLTVASRHAVAGDGAAASGGDVSAVPNAGAHAAIAHGDAASPDPGAADAVLAGPPGAASAALDAGTALASNELASKAAGGSSSAWTLALVIAVIAVLAGTTATVIRRRAD